MTACKDCDREMPVGPGPDLLKLGWNYIDLVEGDDIANGWRCPQCVEGWQIIVEEATRHEFGSN